MNEVRIWVALLLVCSIPLFAHAEEAYLGDTACYSCHKEMKQSYLGGAHGRIFVNAPRNQTEALGCEACHGAGEPHKMAADKEETGAPLMIEAFKKDIGASSGKNRACLKCHEKGKRMHWQGEAHDRAGLSCADCHKIHDGSRSVSIEVCYSCHPRQRAEFQRSSHIPVREGKMTCSSCHNPHGGKGPSLLKDSSVNDTCYSCHPEKRGPFLWEHAPARENCLNCHSPHGSIHPNLLKLKPPYLCQQQCHTPRNHPTNAYSGASIGGGANSKIVAVGKSCLNCHSQVHGSNHPSGAVFQR